MIYTLYGADILNSRIICNALIDSYGTRYIIALYESDKTTKEEAITLQEKFYSISPIISKNHKSPERALPYILAEYHLLNRDMNYLFKTKIAPLNRDDKAIFLGS